MTNNDPDSPPKSKKKLSLHRAKVLVAAAALGALLGTVGLILWFPRGNQSPIPKLSSKRFDDARLRWNQDSIQDYDIEIQVSGLQAAIYNVRVRSGIARSANRNGRPLTQRRTFGTWSVDGMFSTIASDVAHLRKLEDGQPQVGTLQLELRAEFDSEFGYPKRYFRLEQVRFGNNRSVSWQVTKLTIIDRAVEKPPEPSTP